ncbi:MAG TPA: PAS domain S-box protein, partial [Chroococcales cyanobacterium]
MKGKGKKATGRSAPSHDKQASGRSTSASSANAKPSPPKKKLDQSPEARIAELEGLVASQQETLKKLEERERQNHRFFDTAGDAFILLDPQGIIIDWNHQCERLFGWKKEKVLGKSISQVILPERFRKLFEEDLRRFSEDSGAHFINNRIDLSAVRKDGNEFPANISVFPISLSDKITMCALVYDRSDRVRIQQRRAAQYELTRILAEAATVEEAASKILQIISEATGWETGLVWIIDKEIDALCMLEIWQKASSLGDKLEAASKWRQFHVSEGLPGRVWQTH